MHIRVDDPRKSDVAILLREHLEDMALHSPPESVHALDIDELCAPAITFWTAREGPDLLGCGALLELDHHHGEIKSMRTASASKKRCRDGDAPTYHRGSPTPRIYPVEPRNWIDGSLCPCSRALCPLRFPEEKFLRDMRHGRLISRVGAGEPIPVTRAAGPARAACARLIEPGWPRPTRRPKS